MQKVLSIKTNEIKKLICPACGSSVSSDSIIDINGSIACIKCLK